MRLLELHRSRAVFAHAVWFGVCALMGVDMSRRTGLVHYSVLEMAALLLGVAIASTFFLVVVASRFLKTETLRLPSLDRFIISDDDPLQIIYIGVISLVWGGLGGAINEVLNGKTTSWEVPLTAGVGAVIGLVGGVLLTQRMRSGRRAN